MSEITTLLADLAAAGLEVRAEGERLRYRPIEMMTPALAARVDDVVRRLAL